MGGSGYSLFSFFYEKESHSVALAGLKLIMYTRLVSSLLLPPCAERFIVCTTTPSMFRLILKECSNIIELISIALVCVFKIQYFSHNINSFLSDMQFDSSCHKNC